MTVVPKDYNIIRRYYKTILYYIILIYSIIIGTLFLQVMKALGESRGIAVLCF
jgi:hypothetical protein